MQGFFFFLGRLVTARSSADVTSYFESERFNSRRRGGEEDSLC